ncbi:Dehydrogenase/reductase SDR family member 11 [Chionoecetes opilio]|uniref:Dehydrogenase/reductase SDR family member 11 n=1 Tax=Chionoecetes opilio TaxID=41210 RepID=A0A8J4XVZ2_CHIOP|nr:Dehydrogenase/reductase SDR family member 11 [Chionoecetes opilio]
MLVKSRPVEIFHRRTSTGNIYKNCPDWWIFDRRTNTSEPKAASALVQKKLACVILASTFERPPHCSTQWPPPFFRRRPASSQCWQPLVWYRAQISRGPQAAGLAVLSRRPSREMERWSGRVALVTGASAGIGASVARRLGAEGMGWWRRPQRGASAAEGPARGLDPHQVLTSPRTTRFGEHVRAPSSGSSAAWTCASTTRDSPSSRKPAEGSPEEWRSMLDLNVVALCLCTREAVASMRERGVDDGHVIHLNSIAGHYISQVPGAQFYCGTKHMVTTLTEALRLELRRANSKIRISSISPGVVETEFAVNTGMSQDAAQQFYQERPRMQADDVTDSLIHVLAAPPHVQVITDSFHGYL